MQRIIEIDSLDNAAVAPYAHLTEAQLRSENDLFIAESTRVIEYALDAGCEPVSFLMDRRHIEGKASGILTRTPEVPVYTASSETLASLTGFPLTRGVLSAMKRPKQLTVEEACGNSARIAILEGIVDSSNLGAIFRSAAALGMHTVLLSPTCCDPLSRKSLRTSMGTIFRIPWARIPGKASDWPHPSLDSIKVLGFQTAALALRSDSVPVDAPQLHSIDKLAVLLGTEGDGLMPDTIEACDHTVLIPMANGVDSLNVAAAAAIAFWQLAKRS